jgi:hypothetical protein
MLRTFDKRLDALTPSALDRLTPVLYTGMVAVWRAMSLREFVEWAACNRDGADLPPPLYERIIELERVHGVVPVEAQCRQLASDEELHRRIGLLQDADNAGDGEPQHPIYRLWRRFSDAEIDRLCDGTELWEGLLEIAPAYIDVDTPMGEQGL